MYVRAGRPAFARPCVGVHVTYVNSDKTEFVGFIQDVNIIRYQTAEITRVVHITR